MLRAPGAGELGFSFGIIAAHSAYSLPITIPQRTPRRRSAMRTTRTSWTASCLPSLSPTAMGAVLFNQHAAPSAVATTSASARGVEHRRAQAEGEK